MMGKPYRNAHHGMARRRHTSSRHYQRRTGSGCATYVLLLGTAAVTSGWLALLEVLA